MFQSRNHVQVMESIEFVSLLHKQLMEDALVHPDSDKVSELADYKKQAAIQTKKA